MDQILNLKKRTIMINQLRKMLIVRFKLSPNCYLINKMKKLICKYHVLTSSILVKMSCLKMIEVPSVLTNHKNIRYVDAKKRCISTSNLQWRYYMVLRRTV